jgi:hypothetical protein
MVVRMYGKKKLLQTKGFGLFLSLRLDRRLAVEGFPASGNDNPDKDSSVYFVLPINVTS